MKEQSDFLRELKSQKRNLTRQQYSTIKGQALKGNVNDARRGLSRVIGRRGKR